MKTQFKPKKVQLIGFACMSFLFLVLPNAVFGEKLKINTEIQGYIIDSALAAYSKIGIGGNLGIEVDDLFTPKFSLGISASYIGFIPVKNPTAKINGIYGLLNAGYRWELAKGSDLGPYVDVGYGVNIYSGAPGTLVQYSSQLVAGVGIQYVLYLSEFINLDAKLGLRFSFGANKVYLLPELRIGAGFQLTDFKAPPKPVDPKIESFNTTRSALVSLTDVKLIDTGSLDGQRIVVYNSFNANDTTLTPRFSEQFPVILQYLQSIPDLKAIEILSYVAEDEKKEDKKLDRIPLTQTRAQMVMSVVQVTLKNPAINCTGKGMGKKNPIADNKTPEGRVQNFRVEIVLHL